MWLSVGYFLIAKNKKNPKKTSTDTMERAGGQYMNQEIKHSFTMCHLLFYNIEYTILSMKLSCQKCLIWNLIKPLDITSSSE